MAPPTKQAALDLLGALAQELRNAPRDVSVILCPPFVWLPYVADFRGGAHNFSVGAQDVSAKAQGAYTGEVSPAMLSSLGASHVIIGHSERRAMGEANDLIAQKLRAALDAGLTAILCVGERTREGDWHTFLQEQITSALAVLAPEDVPKLLVAYEPVWAIGGSVPDTPEDALTVAILVRKLARERFGERGRALPVLYGGSVEAKTVEPFARQEGLDGVLVGHASLSVGQFMAIVQAIAG